jgi:hypothetical protein
MQNRTVQRLGTLVDVKTLFKIDGPSCVLRTGGTIVQWGTVCVHRHLAMTKSELHVDQGDDNIITTITSTFAGEVGKSCIQSTYIV